MREIMFRGKRLDNGELVYGNLFVSDTDGGTYILAGSRTVTIEWEVVPSTVCQFTGLKDKNGKRIFEGDIVQANFRSNRSKQTFCVGFEDGVFIFDNGSVKVSKDNIYSMKVIGNINDNPELLEGGEAE